MFAVSMFTLASQQTNRVFKPLTSKYWAGTRLTLGTEGGAALLLHGSVGSQSPQLQDSIYGQSPFVRLINLHEVFCLLLQTE